MNSPQKDNKRQELVRFIRFAITGVLNTAVDFGIFTVLGFFGVNIYLSQGISYSCGILNSYIINRSWTFQTKEGFFSRQLLKFLIVNLALLFMSMGILYLLCDVFTLHRLLAKLIATGFTVVAGFILNRIWVF